MLCQIKDWHKFIKEGDQFLNTALAAAQKRSDVFTPEILYNITAMAIEKFLMGFLMFNGDMADNHTMADMIDSVKRHVVLDRTMTKDLLYLDSFQEICDLFNANYQTPGTEDIPRILEIGRNVREFTMGRVTPIAA